MSIMDIYTIAITSLVIGYIIYYVLIFIDEVIDNDNESKNIKSWQRRDADL